MHSIKSLNVPFMTTKQNIDTAAHEIRTWGAVAVIGAGASLMSGLPLSKQLTGLIWTAIDSDPVRS
jgi:hypothetical protein